MKHIQIGAPSVNARKRGTSVKIRIHTCIHIYNHMLIFPLYTYILTQANIDFVSTTFNTCPFCCHAELPILLLFTPALRSASLYWTIDCVCVRVYVAVASCQLVGCFLVFVQCCWFNSWFCHCLICVVNRCGHNWLHTLWHTHIRTRTKL